jgi:serine phosphatase RsbU (regulator of sigma subunit)
MAAGDTLLMASDGLSEREDPDGHQFGIERISQIMVAGDGSPRRIADRLIGAARRFAAGRPRSDDESLLIVQARSGASA